MLVSFGDIKTLKFQRTVYSSSQCWPQGRLEGGEGAVPSPGSGLGLVDKGELSRSLPTFFVFVVSTFSRVL